MGKYKKILVKKIEEEQADEQKQKRLRKETGISNDAYHLKERSWKSYTKEVLSKLGYFIYVILAFIGVMMILHPESRYIWLQILHIS